jgi:penicillin-binding protein 2
MERKTRFRIGVLLVLVAALLGVYTVYLFKLQEPAEDGVVEAQTYTYETTVQAARGSILDCNGNVLVTNRASYNLTINSVTLFNSDDPNGSLLTLAKLCKELELPYEDNLPVSFDTPYTYTLEETSEQNEKLFRLFLSARNLDPDMAPQTLMRELRDYYSIPEDWSEEDARLVIGLRYELSLRNTEGTGLDAYVLASDVSSEDLAAVMELAVPGLQVQTTTVREYNTDYAAHILGYLGPMYAEEYQNTYKELGYPMNAQVGKAGLEQAFETYLHGQDGILVTTVNEDGQVLDEYWKVEPQAGYNVVLTIDIGLQEAAENALEEIILDLRENGLDDNRDGQGRGMDAKGGALVAMEVKTGRVLACASYPTFNLETFYEDYATLSQDPYRPYYNRALAAQPPGSVFKMVTSIAAIDSGGISRYHEIKDLGKYTFYDTYQPECLIYTNTGGTHGIINMMQALSVSCNYYFYEVGRLTGIEAIDEVAKNLGLGEATGIELPEDTGHRANAETKAELYKDNPDLSGWYGADTIAAAIGQSENSFTPMQLAAYTSALANGGPRYKATFLDRVVSSDYKTLIEKNDPELISNYQFSEDAMACVRDGMRLAATEGTASTYLKDYDIAVCAKTGTAEHGAGGSANGSFICYAPADDPEIAIAVYVENGAQGGNLAQAAVAVMDEYFKTAQDDTIAAEGAVG